MSAIPVLLSWSSGKDSAWCLWRLRSMPEYRVVGLLTTLNEVFDRVAMHGVRAALLQAQAQAAGLPLWQVPLPWPCTNEEYEKRMGEVIARARTEGIRAIAFGDLHLTSVREYRERQLAGSGIEALFPLWGENTRLLASEMCASGLAATVTCMDPKRLPRSFAGRSFNEEFLSDLPPEADPCGEYGEFHTFCHAGPMFASPIPVERGETVERDGFVFTDLLPARPLES